MNRTKGFCFVAASISAFMPGLTVGADAIGGLESKTSQRYDTSAAKRQKKEASSRETDDDRYKSKEQSAIPTGAASPPKFDRYADPCKIDDSLPGCMRKSP